MLLIGNEKCTALLLSGHAVLLPTIVNDIADALMCWLQDINSSLIVVLYIQYHCNESSVCLHIVDEEHICDTESSRH